MDDGDRQELVWMHLQAQLKDPGDIEQIEFVFTNAPGEQGEIDTAIAT